MKLGAHFSLQFETGPPHVRGIAFAYPRTRAATETDAATITLEDIIRGLEMSTRLTELVRERLGSTVELQKPAANGAARARRAPANHISPTLGARAQGATMSQWDGIANPKVGELATRLWAFVAFYGGRRSCTGLTPTRRSDPQARRRADVVRVLVTVMLSI